jgi:hypothetical protein
MNIKINYEQNLMQVKKKLTKKKNSYVALQDYKL